MIEPGAQRRRCRLLCVATFFDRRLPISFKKPARMCLADDFLFYFIGLGERGGAGMSIGPYRPCTSMVRCGIEMHRAVARGQLTGREAPTLGFQLSGNGLGEVQCILRYGPMLMPAPPLSPSPMK